MPSSFRAKKYWSLNYNYVYIHITSNLLKVYILNRNGDVYNYNHAHSIGLKIIQFMMKAGCISYRSHKLALRSPVDSHMSICSPHPDRLHH